jgi:hypothetical protein
LNHDFEFFCRKSSFETFYTICGSTVVEHLPLYLKVKGSSPERKLVNAKNLNLGPVSEKAAIGSSPV